MNNKFHCDVCNKGFQRSDALQVHCKSKKHLNNLNTYLENQRLSENFSGQIEPEEALELTEEPQRELYPLMTNVINHFVINKVSSSQTDIIEYINQEQKQILSYLNKQSSIKYQIQVNIILFNMNDHNISSDSYRTIKIRTDQITKIDNSELIELPIHLLQDQLEDAVNKTTGSGWVIDSFKNIKLYVSKINILTAGSYIPLPFTTNNVVNIKNQNILCFKYCIVAALSTETNNLNDPTIYHKYFSGGSDEIPLDFTNVTFPMSLHQIKIFENKNNIKINVYAISYNGGDRTRRASYNLFPLLISKTSFTFVINLLYISEVNGNFHYAYIKNIEKLLKGQIKYNFNSNQHIIICERCLSYNLSQNAADNHKRLCINNNSALIKMPPQNRSKLCFNIYNKMLKVPFIISADIEAINIPLPNVNSNSQNIFKQIPSCIYLRLTSLYPEFKSNEDALFTGVNCTRDFINWIVEHEPIFSAKLIENNPIVMTQEDLVHFINSTHCIYCNNELVNDRIRDHDHFNGKYRGAAHYRCNIQARKPKHVPIYFHNGSGYDFHLIIKELATHNKKIKIIPLTDENYIAFYYGCIRFTDSLRLFQNSIEGVAKSMPDNKFIELKKEFNLNKCILNNCPNTLTCKMDEVCSCKIKDCICDDCKRFKLMVSKGIYPYEYIKSFDVLNETQLPPIEEFNSTLNLSKITNNDYQRAQQVWNAFNCKTLWDYTILYLKQDVCILADALENFRTLFPLDPCHYVSTPGLTWDLGLFNTKIELDLLTDQSMYEMFESGIRGGISSVMGKRYVKANNKYTNPDFDYYYIPEEHEFEEAIKKFNFARTQEFSLEKYFKPNYLLYVDANNLYGHSMSQYLPYKNFQYFKPDSIITINLNINNFKDWLMTIPSDADQGLILEVDLEYTDKITTKRFPLAPEKKIVPFEQFSEDQQQVILDEHKKISHLLINDLNDKTNYVVHYQNLQFYLNHGMTLKKVNRIISFEQKPWLKQYIQHNTDNRTRGTTDFEKDIWKLMNNSFFGKTMENIRKRENIELETNSDRAKKQFTKPTYKRSTIFSEHLIAIHKFKTQIILNKPIYLGFTILELSKLLMYNFFYNVLVPKWKDNIELLYIDTDAFVLNIQTEDLYKDIESDLVLKDEFDFSDYLNTDSPIMFYGDEKNRHKKVIGKMKDELGGKPMFEWIALRSKCYDYSYINQADETITNKIKNKGIQKCVIKKNMNIDQFKESLFKNLNHYETVHSLHSKKHEMLITSMKKLALNRFDTKRWISESNPLETEPFDDQKDVLCNSLS